MVKKLSIILCMVFIFFTGCASKESGQMNPPNKNDVTGIIKTSMGDIKFKLFPEEAPKAVENFKKLAEKGYYNQLTFHRVISDFMIQGGDPRGDGTGGESIWGKPFEDEISGNLHYYRGAMAMANSGPNTNGSQFFIVQKGSISDDNKQEMRQNSFSNTLIEQYEKYGGAHWLEKGFTMPNGYKSTGYTLFGQVYEGMDVVDKIAAVKVGQNSKPQEAVTIISVEIEK